MNSAGLQKHLVLGGARSGKSSYAQGLVKELADSNAKRLVYVATATAQDKEMADRINQHQLDRQGGEWVLREEPLDLASVLNTVEQDQCVLVDCLSLWLSNCLHKLCWEEQKHAFLTALTACQTDVVMVSNEVGSGIVPMGSLTRRFVDEMGWLHQVLAQRCDGVTLVVAGLTNKLK